MGAEATIFCMEGTLSLSQPTSLDITQRFEGSFSSVADVWKNLAELMVRKQKVRQSVDQILLEVEKICDVLPFVSDLFQAEEYSPVYFQAQVTNVWIIREVYFLLGLIQLLFEASSLLRKDQYAKLKKQSKILSDYQKEFDTLLAQKINFSLKDAVLKNRIGETFIQAPLRILLEDDDTGVHVSCFELPQVYGFGETEDEALAMLDREIISLNKDLHDGGKISREFELVKILLDMVFRNEKY